MAKTTEQLVVEITAQLAKARKDVSAFEKQLDAISTDKHVAKITAELANRRDIDKFIDSLDALTDESKTVVLGVEAAAAEKQLTHIRLTMRDLAAQGVDIPVELAAGAATIEGDLQRIEDQIQRINRTPVDVSGGGRVKGGFNDVIDGADQANSAVANMVGNASQDLGELAGVTGSAGVAVGQLAEYFTDSAIAARKAGQSYGAIIGSFAKAALPIAAIAGGIAAFTGAQERANRRTEEATANLQAFGEAMRTAGVDALGLKAALSDQEESLRNFDASMSLLGGFGTTLNDFGKSIPVLGSLFQDTSVDIIDALDAAGLSMYQFVKGFSGTEAERAKFLSDLRDFHDAGLITSDQYKALTQRTKENSQAVDDARQAQHLWNVDQAEANDLLQDYLNKQRPFQRFAQQWKVLFDDLADGTADTKASADAINFLAEQLGIDPGDVLPMAMEELDRAQQDSIQSTKDWAAAQQKAKDAADDLTVTLTDAATSLEEMASAFGGMTRREGAIEDAFAIGNAPLDAEVRMADLRVAIEDLAAFVREHGPPISDGIRDLTEIDFAGGEVHVEPFLQKLEAVRGPIQRKVADVFATQGAEAARATAQSLLVTLSEALDGALSPEELDVLLFGPEGHTAVIDIAIDQDSLAKAKGMLEILTGLGGETPFTAAIKLALLNEDITPQAAEILVREAIGEHGVPIPAELKTPDTTEAKAEADRWARDPRNAVAMQSKLGTPFNTTQAYNDTQRALNRLPPLKFKTALSIPFVGQAYGLFNDAGTPSVRRPGGIVAELGPEILNGRYLATQPTWVPPGTRVTSRRETARILRVRGARGLRHYDSGGVVGGPSTVNVNFNGVGAVGNRYDLMRTIKRANLDRLRLQGTRP